jgi:hypothetical protein
MTATALPFRKPAPRAFGFWLGLALSLHALLLLIPARETQSPKAAGRPLEIRLTPRNPPLAAAVPPPAAIAQEAAPSADARPDTGARDPGTLSGAPAAVPDADAATDLENPAATATWRHAPTARTLLETIARGDWGASADEPARSLGRPWPRRENRPQPGGLQPGPNRFDGVLAPARPEVVDRWLAADGSHNVVVHASSGETYCGRSEAWNPMNPLYEPIMTWRPCGGGGERRLERLSSAKIKPRDHDGREPRSR